MNQANKLHSGALLVFILTAGVFGIINTEMGVIGILPLIAETFHVTVPEAGWTVSVFALVVAASAPVTPLLFSGINRKKVMLLVYGLANIAGNMIAGRQLARNPTRSMAVIPFALLGFYTCLFFMGEWLVATGLIILSLGILAGYGQNTMQYMMTHAAPEAPDFANALFLLSANLGTMLGAAVCGAFITAFDTRYSLFGSLLFLVTGILFVALRIPGRKSSGLVCVSGPGGL